MDPDETSLKLPVIRILVPQIPHIHRIGQLKLYPYMSSVLFVGHMQTVQPQNAASLLGFTFQEIISIKAKWIKLTKTRKKSRSVKTFQT